MDTARNLLVMAGSILNPSFYFPKKFSTQAEAIADIKRASAMIALWGFWYLGSCLLYGVPELCVWGVCALALAGILIESNSRIVAILIAVRWLVAIGLLPIMLFRIVDWNGKTFGEIIASALLPAFGIWLTLFNLRSVILALAGTFKLRELKT
jgi:hypothetical protein